VTPTLRRSPRSGLRSGSRLAAILGIAVTLSSTLAADDDEYDPSPPLAKVRIEGPAPRVFELNQESILPKRDPGVDLGLFDEITRVFTLTSMGATDQPVVLWRTEFRWKWFEGEVTADLAVDGAGLDMVVARSHGRSADIWAWRVDVGGPKASKLLFAKSVQSTLSHDAIVQPRIAGSTVRLTVLHEPGQAWGEALILPR